MNLAGITARQIFIIIICIYEKNVVYLHSILIMNKNAAEIIAKMYFENFLYPCTRKICY